MSVRIVPASTTGIAEAAARLDAGDVVAFPTETVYGLGASTFDSAAIQLIFELKGRPADNPLIAHVPPGEKGDEYARRLSSDWNDARARMAAHFWPGPIAFVVEKHPDVPAGATAGRDTIAIRCPRHDVARDLLAACASPISAPSANRSGHTSPTSAAHVADDLAEAADALDVDLIVLDGGPCAIGLESTVVDLTRTPPALLRPGMVSARELAPFLGSLSEPLILQQDASPGTASRHYAPHVCVQLVAREFMAAELAASATPVFVLGFAEAPVTGPHVLLEMPQGAGEYGARLYAKLRHADRMALQTRATIFIEMPPDSNDAWRAIHDRLMRMVAPAV